MKWGELRDNYLVADTSDEGDHYKWWSWVPADEIVVLCKDGKDGTKGRVNYLQIQADADIDGEGNEGWTLIFQLDNCPEDPVNFTIASNLNASDKELPIEVYRLISPPVDCSE